MNENEEAKTFIGFSSLADQVHRKSVKRGFEFTLMVVGESGLGKSTLINSLFLTDLYQNRKMTPVSDKKTTDIEKTTLDIEEAGVKLRLTIVDTPGFGDGLEGSHSWEAIVKYVDHQHKLYFQNESGVNRRQLVDTRVHCCLYFIAPYGRGLRQIDVEFLKRLQYRVNLVPVIAKADCLTMVELKNLKKQINQEIVENDLEIYQFPDCDSEEDEEFKKQDEKLKASLPFAIVGANTIQQIGGRKVRGRQYPWGLVDIENPLHSDFSFLRRFLIQTHMQDLKDVTHDVHYENYRVACINEMKASGIQVECGPFGSLAGRSKLKRESTLSPEPEYEDPETLMLLQQKDDEIKQMQQMLHQMQEKLKNGTNS